MHTLSGCRAPGLFATCYRISEGSRRAMGLIHARQFARTTPGLIFPDQTCSASGIPRAKTSPRDKRRFEG